MANKAWNVTNMGERWGYVTIERIKKAMCRSRTHRLVTKMRFRNVVGRSNGVCEGKFRAEEKWCDLHTAFTGKLHFKNFESAVGGIDEHTVTFNDNASGSGGVTGGGASGENLELEGLDGRVGCIDGGPCRGIWGEPADVVVKLRCRAIPVDPASLLKYFGSGSGLLTGGEEGLLWNGDKVAGNYVANGVDCEIGSEVHETIVDGSDVFIGCDGDALLRDDVAGIDFVAKEEGSYSGHGIAIHHGAVDGCCSAVAWEEGGVEIECAERRHGPYDFGKHPECNHNEKVGIESAQLLNKFRVLEIDGLEEVEGVGEGVFLDVALEHVVTASGRFVGHRHNSNYIIAFGDNAIETFDGKFGGAEKYYAEIFFFHVG